MNALTAKCGRGIPGADSLLAHAVVRELDVALVIQKNVVQFQISIDDSWKKKK